MKEEGVDLPMARTLECSRRIALFAVSLPFARFCGASKSDAELSELWPKFVELSAKLDSDHSKICDLDRFETLFEEICCTPANTIDGLCIKARVGCWTLMGDFDSAGKSTPEARIAFSIMQDLIRTYHSALERPGAVRRLLDDMEQNS